MRYNKTAKGMFFYETQTSIADLNGFVCQ